VNSVEEAVSVLPRLIRIDRRAVRRRFEERFSVARMATDYLSVYRGLDATMEEWRAQADPTSELTELTTDLPAMAPELNVVPPSRTKARDHHAN
jgi:hypothetical protein